MRIHPDILVRWVFASKSHAPGQDQRPRISRTLGSDLDPQSCEVHVIWITCHMHIPLTLKVNRPCMCGVSAKRYLTPPDIPRRESSSNTTDFWYGSTHHYVSSSGPFSQVWLQDRVRLNSHAYRSRTLLAYEMELYSFSQSYNVEPSPL